MMGFLMKIDWNGITNPLKDEGYKTNYKTICIRLFHPIWIDIEVAPHKRGKNGFRFFHNSKSFNRAILFFWWNKLSIYFSLRKRALSLEH